MEKVSASALCISVFILLSAVHAFAGAPTAITLRGDYYLVGSRSCVYTNGGQEFLANFYLPSNGGNTRTGHYEGVLHLNGDGTGNLNSNLIQYYLPAINAGQQTIGYWSNSCEVSYEKLPNGFIIMNFILCEDTGEAGIGSGHIWVDDGINMNVAASGNGDVLLLSNTYPAIEHTTRLVPSFSELYRICSRTFTAIRQSIR